MSAIASIAGIIRTHAEQRPDAVAIEYEGRSITFGAMHERSNRLAQALRDHGVGAGDRVAYLEKNGPEYFEVAFALGKLNAVSVGVNWRLAPPEIADIIADAGARIVIVGPDFVDHVERIESGFAPGTTVLATGGHDRWTDYDAFVASGDDVDPGAASAGTDVALQLYTSGTTGLPKGVMLTNQNFFGMVGAVTGSWRFTSDSVSIAVMPMFHIAGCGWAMVGLYHGCRTVLLRDVDPMGILAAIPAFGVTNALFVPAVIQFLLASPGVDRVDFSTLRAIVYGASPINESVLAHALETFGCEFIQVYGLTETTGAVTQLDGADHRADLLRSCGRAYPWMEIRVVDNATGDDVEPGAVGELWIRGRQVMKGYWNNDEATGAAVTEDGWFKSGDAGFVDSDGFIFLHDRVKDMIVSGGENIYPAEVESALAKHPGIADVAVIGVPDDRWGEAVKAVVVSHDGAALTADAVMAFAREHLGGFKVPKSVDFVEVLPRNPSGKLLKREIRAPYWIGRDRQIG